VLNKGINYAFDIDDSVLAFRTNSFRAEKGSVLHSGIYNRETASVFAAGACLILLGFFFAAMPHFSIVYSAAVLLLFVLFFLFFRTFVFPEAVLQVVVDRRNNVVTVARTESRLHSGKMLFPLAELWNIREDCKEFTLENSDGRRFVEKISVQHGAVIPDFGTPAQLYTVEFEFMNASGVMVFSSGDCSEAADVAGTFKNFLIKYGTTEDTEKSSVSSKD
jgi:hypothetical protein